MHFPQVRPLLYAIDDAADYRFLLQQVFNRFLPEYDLRLFDGGVSLSAILDSDERPGLILLDVQMPIMSGPQVVRILRKRDQWRRIPIVIMSNTQSPHEIADCYEAGANSFLVKPTDVENMQKVMQSLCSYWFGLNRPSL